MGALIQRQKRITNVGHCKNQKSLVLMGASWGNNKFINQTDSAKFKIKKILLLIL